VPSPAVINYFLIGCPLFFAFLALLLRGRSVIQRVLMIVVVSAACLLFHLFGPGPMRFSWSQEGILDASFREVQHIAWSQISELRLVKNFRSSEVKPVLRTSGVAHDGFSAGFYKVANGATLRVFLAPQSCDALLIRTSTATYLYAPPSFELFRHLAETQWRRSQGR
jgi:hypothetical protein